jgi:hypothetical protein
MFAESDLSKGTLRHPAAPSTPKSAPLRILGRRQERNENHPLVMTGVVVDEQRCAALLLRQSQSECPMLGRGNEPEG